jgi:hypothetical protein
MKCGMERFEWKQGVFILTLFLLYSRLCRLCANMAQGVRMSNKVTKLANKQLSSKPLKLL